MSRRRRGLDHEDRALWQRVTETVRPLSGPPQPPQPAPEPPLPLPPVLDPPLTRPQGLPAIPTFRLGEAAPPPPATRIDLAPAAAPPGPSALPLDRRTRSRLARGTTGPEARIDLHGMTLAEAQSALTRFVLAQQTQGRRLVLVITGKGRPGDSGGPVPERPGVLRRHVPEWLRRPPLAAAVVAVTQAHLRHGGSGAYYVALRRLR